MFNTGYLRSNFCGFRRFLIHGNLCGFIIIYTMFKVRIIFAAPGFQILEYQLVSTNFETH